MLTTAAHHPDIVIRRAVMEHQGAQGLRQVGAVNLGQVEIGQDIGVDGQKRPLPQDLPQLPQTPPVPRISGSWLTLSRKLQGSDRKKSCT